MAHSIKNVKTLQSKSKTHEVTPTDHPRIFEVTSGNSGETYLVAIDPQLGASCSCPWGTYRPKVNNYRSGCSHVQAVFNFMESQDGRAVSAWSNPDDAKRQHRPIIELGDGVILTSRKV